MLGAGRLVLILIEQQAFLDRTTDPLEINNGINEAKYQPTISELKGYFHEYTARIPATGKDEMIKMILDEK